MIIEPIWHPMEMHSLSAGYEHHLPPTTTAHHGHMMLTNGHKCRPDFPAAPM